MIKRKNIIEKKKNGINNHVNLTRYYLYPTSVIYNSSISKGVLTYIWKNMRFGWPTSLWRLTERSVKEKNSTRSVERDSRRCLDDVRWITSDIEEPTDIIKKTIILQQAAGLCLSLLSLAVESKFYVGIIKARDGRRIRTALRFSVAALPLR